MPVEQLLGEDEQPLALTRSCPLSCDDIRALLRGGGVRFVLANVGHPFAWAEGPEVFKGLEDRGSAAPGTSRCPRPSWRAFPGEYVYFASLWTASDRQDEGAGRPA